MAKGVQLKVFLAGRVAVETGGASIAEGRLPGRQGRLLFAYLAFEQGRAVPRDELAEALWGESLPATWDKALTVGVSKLRGLLTDFGLDGATALTGAFGCYRLELPAGTWVDVIVAANAVQEAEEALAAGDVEQAKPAAALGAALVEQPFLPGEEGAWVDEKRRELADIRGRALTVLADACLRSGDAADAVKWAEQAIALAPFRETGYRRLMEAHTVAGNRAEALQVYERCRRLLAEELGAYPSPETESIYRSLLDAPSAHAGETAAADVPPRGAAPTVHVERGSKSLVLGTASRKRVAAATLIVALTAAAVAGVVATRSAGDSQATAVAANSIVALDPSGSIAASVSVGARPVAIASGAGALWVANLDDRSVTRVDVTSRQAVRTIPAGDAPTALAATTTAVWMTHGAGDLSRIDPRYDRVTSTVQVGASGFFGETSFLALAAFGSLWIVDPKGIAWKLDPDSDRVLGSVGVGNQPSAIAAGAGSVWVTNSTDGTVTRIDPSTLVTRTIPVGHGPTSLAVNAAGTWVANAGDNALVRIDTETNVVAGSTPVGEGPTAVVASPTALWVANGRDGTVMRLDPRTGDVTKLIRLGGTPTAFAAAGGQVWVAIAPGPPRQPAAGGVARLVYPDIIESIDPALAPYWLAYPRCANLVTYPDKPAPEGSRIVPEVAEAIPLPTGGGTTYTFRIRPGFRFSPPSNEVVTAMTFKSTIERVASPRLESIFASQFSGIVGYQAYVSGKAREISGIAARGNTLTITLSHPDGGFLANLAGGSACAVPRDTPAVPGIDAVPSAGPYYVASYTPRQQLALERNPNYHGDRPHHFDRIVIAIGVDPARALKQVEAGEADYAFGVPREAGPRLESMYGPGSAAAKAGHQQYFVSQAMGVRYLHMNTSRPLFSDVRLRRAVNFAIDRPALVEQGRRAAVVNPFNAGAPTDDYLSPSATGARDFHLYPVDGPDLRRAKQLAGRVRATAVMYTAHLSPWREEAQIIRRNLEPLGIEVEVKEFPISDYYTRISRRGEPFDLALNGLCCSPEPAQLLSYFYGGASGNFSYFDDPVFNRGFEAMVKLSGAERYRAAARLALELQRDGVPAAAFAVTASLDFFSKRIGCQVYHPVWGIDLAALCLRS